MPVLDRPLVVPNTFSRYESMWNVILWNDDVTGAERVVYALVTVVKIDPVKATQIMLEAHNNGRALVISDSKDKCQTYQTQLEQHGLTITIEPAL